MTILYNTEQQTVESVTRLLAAHGYDPAEYDLEKIAADYLHEPGLYNSVFENPSIVWAYVDDHHTTPAPIHPGAFVQLTTGPYKAVLWGDEVFIPAFMVDRIEGDTVHCYYPPYSFQWPISDLVAVDRPTEYGANHDDWIREARSTFTYATEYESEYDDD